MTAQMRALKRATGEMINGNDGLIEAAKRCRVGKSVLADYASQNNDNCFVPVDVVIDLEPLARDRKGWPHVTRELCEAMGGAFVLLPEARPDADDVHAALGTLVKEHGDAVATIIAGFADRRAEPRELESALKELREMIEAAVQLKVLLGRMLEEAR